MSLPSRLPAILQAVMQGQPQALADSHYPQWHLAPVNGLLNDLTAFAGRRALPPVLSVEPARLRPYL